MSYKILNLTIILTLFFAFYNNLNSKQIDNFNDAKNISININKKIPGTFYCGCKILWNNKKGIPDLKSCGYKIRKNKIRANRIEWEHVVPVSEFGHNMSCWKKGGRKNCFKDTTYKIIETDLHNLQPSIGEINGDRANYKYSEWNGGKSIYGKCSVKIDFKNKKIEPPIKSRGAIARTYLYMHDKYKIDISKKQIQLFNIWNKKYPATIWECKRNYYIFKIQGNLNPYIIKSCKNINKN